MGYTVCFSNQTIKSLRTIPNTHLVGDTGGSVFGVNGSEKRDVSNCCRELIHDFLDINLEPYALRWLSYPSPCNLILLNPS